jgi:hypothetical protein
MPVSNGPTEAVNNLIKRVKRAAFGFTSFRNYRHPVIALRRQAQLGAARHHHTPLKSEAPPMGDLRRRRRWQVPSQWESEGRPEAPRHGLPHCPGCNFPRMANTSVRK